MIGNVGGAIGLILGYRILQIPGVFTLLGRQIPNWFGNRKTTIPKNAKPEAYFDSAENFFRLDKEKLKVENVSLLIAMENRFEKRFKRIEKMVEKHCEVKTNGKISITKEKTHYI